MHQTCAGDHLFVEQSASQERPVDGRHDLFEGVGDLLFVVDLDRGRALAYDDGGRGLDPLYAQQLKVLEQVVPQPGCSRAGRPRVGRNSLRLGAGTFGPRLELSDHCRDRRGSCPEWRRLTY